MFLFRFLQEMESWVNSVLGNKKTTRCILGVQLKRAMTSFDIYLETESAINSPSDTAEFMPEKTFVKAFRGRSHSRPFKAIQNGSNIIYTQL